MKKQLDVMGLLLPVLLVVLFSTAADATVHRYVEDFSTTQYKDTLNTTAWWDTVTGEIKLWPFEVTLAGSYNTPGAAEGVALAGDYAYVGDYTSGLEVIQAFQRSLNQADHIAQSLEVDQLDDEIIKAKLMSAQTDSIQWEVSADDGANWQEVAPDGNWHTIATPGSDLIWRSTHIYLGGVINPTCTNLEIERLYDFAVIDSIVDIPDDQGHQVRIRWTRSGYDFVGSSTPITEYAIYRKIDPNLSTSPDFTRLQKGGLDSKISLVNDQRVLFYPPGEWDSITTVPADCEDKYAAVVPTLADSTVAEGMYYTTFFVRARTATPGVYFDSDPDSGYSVDNLPPSTPQGLTAVSGDTSIDLAWNAIPDDDFRYYAVYMGTESGFTPDSSNLLGTTIDTAYSDTAVISGATYYYRVSAFDFAGNESGYSNETYEVGIHSRRNRELPKTFSLSQNYPNPFNPVTEIRYALPRDCQARLEVYNILGQRVVSLVDGEQKAGYKTARWDASSFSSGIYFYRLQAGDFVQTRRMILIR